MNILGLIFVLILTIPTEASLSQRLQQLTASHEGKVGLTFIDLKTGWQFSVNGSREFPAASVAKVPVMAAAFHLADAGQISLEKKIQFKEKDRLGGSGVLQWIKAGNSYTLWNLSRMMIVLSDNTATKLVVDFLTLPSIADYLRSYGLSDTIIADPTMLREPPANNRNVTTPNDLARLLLMIYNRQGFSKGSVVQMLSFMKNQRYHWGIWRGVPPGTMVADKTGNLEGILNDVGIVYTKKGNYILSIFTNGYKKQREARLLINAISKIAYEEYTGEKVIQKKAARSTKRLKAKNTKWENNKKVHRKYKKPAKITKKKLSRRPSGKSQPRTGHSGRVSNHK